jgi:alpha-1,2-mannosyltransferase
VAVISVAAQRMHSNDFWPYYWAATQSLTEPHRIYTQIPIDAFGHRVPPFVYPPTAILFFLPFAAFQPGMAAWLLFILSVGLAAIVSFRILPRTLPPLGATKTLTSVVVISTFANYPFYATLIHGQINVIAAFLLIAFFVLHRRSRIFWSAACLALAIALKLFPAVFLIPLALRRRFLDVGFVVLLLTVMVAATIGGWGRRLWSDWLANVVDSGGFGRLLPALAPDLLAYNISINGTLVRMWEPSTTTAALAAVLGALMLALSIRDRRRHLPLRPSEVASVGLVMFCAAPISWVHHLAMVIPLIAVAILEVGTLGFWAIPYAMLCFKWDWPWGSVMLGSIAPPTLGAIALWIWSVRLQRSLS